MLNNTLIVNRGVFVHGGKRLVWMEEGESVQCTEGAVSERCRRTGTVRRDSGLWPTGGGIP